MNRVKVLIESKDLTPLKLSKAPDGQYLFHSHVQYSFDASHQDLNTFRTVYIKRDNQILGFSLDSYDREGLTSCFSLRPDLPLLKELVVVPFKGKIEFEF